MGMLSTPQERLLALHKKLKSWHKVAAKKGVSSAMAWRVGIEGYEPEDKEIRKKLDFPEKITIQVKRDKKGQFS